MHDRDIRFCLGNPLFSLKRTMILEIDQIDVSGFVVLVLHLGTKLSSLVDIRTPNNEAQTKSLLVVSCLQRILKFNT